MSTRIDQEPLPAGWAPLCLEMEKDRGTFLHMGTQRTAYAFKTEAAWGSPWVGFCRNDWVSGTSLSDLLQRISDLIAKAAAEAI